MTKWYYTNMRLMAADMKASTLSYEGSGGYVPHSFASVEEGLAAIDRGGPENLTSDTLREDLKWFTIQQRTLEAMSARRLADDASITLSPATGVPAMPASWGGMSGEYPAQPGEGVLVDDRGEILHVGHSSRSVPKQPRKALNLRDRHA